MKFKELLEVETICKNLIKPGFWYKVIQDGFCSELKTGDVFRVRYFKIDDRDHGDMSEHSLPVLVISSPEVGNIEIFNEKTMKYLGNYITKRGRFDLKEAETDWLRLTKLLGDCGFYYTVTKDYQKIFKKGDRFRHLLSSGGGGSEFSSSIIQTLISPELGELIISFNDHKELFKNQDDYFIKGEPFDKEIATADLRSARLNTLSKKEAEKKDEADRIRTAVQNEIAESKLSPKEAYQIIKRTLIKT